MASCLREAALIPDTRNHATEMRKEEKRKYLLETLEMAKKYGARLFYIENPNYESEKSNSELYLRMMAEGILQLLQVLNAYHEWVELKVLIAQRQDFRRGVRIDEKEYVARLDYCIKQKKKANHILFDAQTKLSFKLAQAKNCRSLSLLIMPLMCGSEEIMKYLGRIGHA